MQLDIPTLMISFAVIAVATAGALARFKAIGNGRVAVSVWIRGYVLMATGMGLLTAEGSIRNDVLNIAAQSLTLFGAFHLPAALGALHRGTWNLRRILIITALFALLMTPAKTLGGFRFEVQVIALFYGWMAIAGIRELLLPRVGSSVAEGSRIIEWTIASFFAVLIVILFLNAWWFLAYETRPDNWTQNLLMLTAILTATGLTIGFHWLIHRDIEFQLERLNGELSDRNQRLTAFTTAISHDLKSPLTAVLGNVDLVLASAEGLSDPDRSALADAGVAAARMNRMIEDLLAWARVDGMERSEEVADATDCIEEALVNLAPELSESGATVDTPRGSLLVRCTHPLLVHLFQNLIANAIKYRAADRTPHVAVDVTRARRQLHFAIIDNGIGVDPDDRERVFELFSRGMNPASVDGSGVGLAFCRTIVEKHGGRIWIEPSVSEGTVVRFSLEAA